MLDEKNIEHDDEANIRRKLRRRVDVKTTATQFFLDPNAKTMDMDRKNCKPHSSIIIPNSDLPQEFFEILEQKERKWVTLINSILVFIIDCL